MATFGETLKRERELREITLRQVSEATKINIRYLEALEQNRFDNLPGGLFNKGFIRAYAAYIGLDGEAMVTSYLQEISGPGLPGRGAPPGLHRPQETPRRRATPPPVEPPPPLAITFGPPAAAASPATDAASPVEVAPAATPHPAGQHSVGPPPDDERAAVARADPAGLAEPHPRPAPSHASAPARPTPPRFMPQRPSGDAAQAREALMRVAVSHIEEAPQPSAGSRTLLFIMLFVGVAGFVFLALSLLIPRPAAPAGGRAAPLSANAGAAPVPAEPGEAARDAASAPPEVIAAGVGNAADVGSPAGAAAHPAAPHPQAPAHPPATGHAAASAPAAESHFGEPRLGERHSDEPPATDAAPPAGTAAAAAAPPANVAPRAGRAGAAGGQRPGDVMEVRVEAARASWVQLFCDGRESINWVMGKHETHDLRCLRIVQVSAADADAVRLTVNGADCASLGDKGARVHGYAIRIEDFRQICPSPEGERDGQP